MNLGHGGIVRAIFLARHKVNRPRVAGLGLRISRSESADDLYHLTRRHWRPQLAEAAAQGRVPRLLSTFFYILTLLFSNLQDFVWCKRQALPDNL